MDELKTGTPVMRYLRVGDKDYLFGHCANPEAHGASMKLMQELLTNVVVPVLTRYERERLFLDAAHAHLVPAMARAAVNDGSGDGDAPSAEAEAEAAAARELAEMAPPAVLRQCREQVGELAAIACKEIGLTRAVRKAEDCLLAASHVQLPDALLHDLLCAADAAAVDDRDLTPDEKQALARGNDLRERLESALATREQPARNEVLAAAAYYMGRWKQYREHYDASGLLSFRRALADRARDFPRALAEATERALIGDASTAQLAACLTTAFRHAAGRMAQSALPSGDPCVDCRWVPIASDVSTLSEVACPGCCRRCPACLFTRHARSTVAQTVAMHTDEQKADAAVFWELAPSSPDMQRDGGPARRWFDALTAQAATVLASRQADAARDGRRCCSYCYDVYAKSDDGGATLLTARSGGGGGKLRGSAKSRIEGFVRPRTGSPLSLSRSHGGSSDGDSGVFGDAV